MRSITGFISEKVNNTKEFIVDSIDTVQGLTDITFDKITLKTLRLIAPNPKEAVKVLIEAKMNPFKIVETLGKMNSGYIKAPKKATSLKYPNPNINEKPITVFYYKSGTLPTPHLAAEYDGVRLDFHPQELDSLEIAKNGITSNNLDKTKTSNILLRLVRKETLPAQHLNESILPPDVLNKVTCYQIYPNQLGKTPEEVKNAFKKVRTEGLKKGYNLHENNCADQVLNVFKELGLDYKKGLEANISITSPADARNFFENNSQYFIKINTKDAPFNNDVAKVKELTEKLKKNPDALIITSPETLAKEIGELLEKNKELSSVNEMYRTINSLPDDKKELLIKKGLNSTLDKISQNLN